MKNLYCFLIYLGMSCLIHAQTLLTDLGNGIILDQGQNLMWLQDASYAVTTGFDADGLMTYHEAQTFLAQLDIGGYTDWRLPEMTETLAWDNSSSEISYLYTEYNISGLRYNDPTDYSGPFINIPPHIGYYDSISFWTGTEDAQNPGMLWVYMLEGPGYWSNYYGFIDTASTSNVWAVRSVVPESAAYSALMAAAAFSWVIWKGRRIRKF